MVAPEMGRLFYPTKTMCVKQEQFEKLSDTVNDIKIMLNDVKNTGVQTLGQATRTNSRVDKLEDKYNQIDDNIHTLKRYRAGRYADCPNRMDIDTLKENMVTQKAVKREMRFWFMGVIIPILGLAIAFLKYVV